MTMSQDDQEAYSHFKETLDAELKQNVKTVIMSLTMLAEDYKASGALIVRAVEEYIKEVTPDIKILGLYLMDSITKNLKSNTNYVELFQRNLINVFTHVFSNVNESNRAALYKLRQTWSNYFSNNTLFAIDVTINKIDPAWPITAAVASTAASSSASSTSNNSNSSSAASPPNRNLAPAASGGSSSSSSSLLTSRPSVAMATGGKPPFAVLMKPTATSTAAIAVTQESKEKLGARQASPIKAPPANISALTAKLATSQIQAPQTDPRLARDPRLANKPRAAPQPASNEQQAVTESQQTTPKKQQQMNAAVSPGRSQSTAPGQVKATMAVNGMKRTSPGSNFSADSGQPVETKKPKFSNTTNHSNEPNAAKPAAAAPASSTSVVKGQQQQQSTVQSTSNQATAVAAVSKLKQQGGGNNENTVAALGKTVAGELTSKPVATATQPRPTANNNAPSTQPPASSSKPVVKSPNESVGSGDKKENENVLAGANKSKPGASKAAIPSLFDVDMAAPVALGAANKPAPKFKIGKLSEKTASTVAKQPATVTAENGTASSNRPTAVTVNKKPVNTTAVNPVRSTTSKPPPVVVAAAENGPNGKTTVVVESDNPFQNDKDLRLDAQAPAPSSTAVENILRQISSLSSLVSSPRDGSDTDSRSPQIGGGTSPPPPADSTTESTLAGNSDKLTQLHAKLNDSKENDKNTNNSRSSTLTLELTNAIRQLLEQQKKLLGGGGDANRRQTPVPEPAVAAQQPPPAAFVIKPMIDPKITQLIQQQQTGNTDALQQQHVAVPGGPTPSRQQDQVTYDLPPIRPRDLNENTSDSLLIIDGRSYKIQPDVRRLVKIYYHDHELFCDTRTKDVYIDGKRVYKMGDATKEVPLNGRRVRLMYMGKRIECWIDGISFNFRADSPPKQISLTSSNHGNQIKRYYVTIDSRSMEMLFNNHRVCTVNTGAAAVMAQLTPDDFERHEISFVCPPKRIMIDGVPRTMRYDLPVPCIEMDGGIYYVIRFSGPPKEIFIDNAPYRVPFDKAVKIKLHGRTHELAWGGPGFEVIIDGRPYELQFNKPAREITIGTRNHFVYIGGEAPDVKICGRLPYELYNANERPSAAAVAATATAPQQPATATSASTSSSSAKASSLDIHQLLQNLVAKNLLPTSQQQQQPQQQQQRSNDQENSRHHNHHHSKHGGGGRREQQQRKEIERIPDLTNFDSNLLRQKHSGAIDSLYSGVQCATCGNRFNQNNDASAAATVTTASGQSRYAKHLDWHFRQNKREKEEVNKAHSRTWYYSFPEWIQNEEISEEQQILSMDAAANSPRTAAANHQASGANDNDGGATGGGGRKRKKHSAAAGDDSADDDDDDLINAVGSSLSNGAAAAEATASLNASALNSFTSNGTKICAATNDIGDSCDICKDPFEIFWHNEKEEWYFKEAMRVGDRVYHPICYEDRDESMISTSVPSTPTPTPATSSNVDPLSSTLMGQNLSQQLETAATSTALSAVKDEPADEEDTGSNQQQQLKQQHHHQHQLHHHHHHDSLVAHMHDIQMKEVA